LVVLSPRGEGAGRKPPMTPIDRGDRRTMPEARLPKDSTGMHTYIGRVRAARDRRRRRVRLGMLLVLLTTAALVGLDLTVYADRIHPGVRVTGVSLAGKSLQDAAARLSRLAEATGAREIRFTLGERMFTTTLDALGWQPDAEATAREALTVGWSGAVWDDMRTRARAWFRPISVPWQYSWDRSALRAVVAEWNQEVGVAPREGRVRGVEGRTEVRYPEPGRAVDEAEVKESALDAISTEASRHLSLKLEPVAPRTTDEDVDRAAAEVRRLVSEPLAVEMGKLTLEVSPDELGTTIRTRVVEDGQDASLEVILAPSEVEALLEPHRDQVERRPRSARFVTQKSKVRIEPSVPGRRIDPEDAADHLLEIARSPDRSGRIPLASVAPSLTSEEARALGIVEEVAAFTTSHEAGEPRVTNIHRAADILDGTIVMPGERVSLNETLGPRTADRGFVEAPVIYDGRFTTDVGGGVSQLATTVFNAAFFGGYPIPEHQAHSYYISRYPQGREATISWPEPDLVFENDTSTGLLVVTEYTHSSITVRIFGDRHGRKVRATDPVVTDHQASGYWVVVRRIIEQSGEVVGEETFRTFYRYGDH
jgi:vancomycin resistance protein YoaR